MAKAFIEECNINSYIIRRDDSSANFIEKLKQTFEEAKEKAPSIILLDDLDKFATEDRNAEEFVVVQSGIDEIKEANVLYLLQ